MTDKFCPCCGETLAFVGVQEWPAKMNRKPTIYLECTNIDCLIYHDTGCYEGLVETCEKRLAERDKQEE